MNSQSISRADDVALPMDTEVSQPTTLTACGYACAVLWTAVRDGTATLSASLITLGGLLGARSLLSSVPGVFHGAGVLTTAVNAVAAGRFGWVIGEAAGGGCRRWVGGAVCAAASVTLNVIAIWVVAKDSGTTAVKLFGTMVYSGLREAIQGQVLKPRLPDMGLCSGRSLRWEGGSNTGRHVLRLGLQMVSYALICVSLNGIAQSNVVSPNFNTLDQSQASFGLQSLQAYGFRTFAEALDAVVGSALLLGLYRQDVEIRSQTRCRVENAPGWRDWAREGSSRMFMNGVVASITSMFGSYLGTASMLSAITTVRGALANVKPAATSQVHHRVGNPQPGLEVATVQAYVAEEEKQQEEPVARGGRLTIDTEPESTPLNGGSRNAPRHSTQPHISFAHPHAD